MKRLKKILSQYSRVLLLLLIIGILAILKPEAFWNWGNITTVIFQQAPFTMLMSFGMTLAIVTKGIDKSMGSVLVLSNVIAATFVKNEQILLGILIALMIGIICGICNGLLITKAGIPPFVATYGVDFITLGLAYVYTGGVSIYGFSDEFRKISTFSIAGITSLAMITFIILLNLQFMMKRTAFGRGVYLAGTNFEATMLSGIDGKKTIIIVYMINGLLAAVTGILYMARLNAADPGISGNFTLDSIAATLIGGNSFIGGEGSVTNAAVGALIIVFIRNGMNILGVETTWQQAAIGFVILASIGLEACSRMLMRNEE
ncbi:ABC transporter permease [Lachnospiraceae bacterium 62-35]